ncbi:MAG: MalY/PatB family protein [Anaerolineae bacterium]
MTKTYDFDTLHDRQDTSSIKWSFRMNDAGQIVPLKPDDIPLWVAEMEFPNPPEIREALKRRIDHGFFGYTASPEPLKQAVVERVKRLYDWDIQPEWVLFNPGMVMFLSVITRALTQPGSGVLMNTPVYGPFLSRPPQFQRFAQKVPLVRVEDDAHTFHYEVDFDSFEQAITSQTEMYYLCNPHNPLGKSFRRDELERLAEICLKHDVLIVSDDIHCDLMLGGTPHTPISTLSPEVEKNSIFMMAGTKTFNMAGIACSVAIIPDDAHRQKVAEVSWGSGYHVDTLAYEALLAGYQECGEWLRQTNQKLTENRDLVVNFVCEHLPMVKTTVPDATYMNWMDFSAITLPEQYGSVTEFLAQEAGVIFSPGSFFGDNLNDYVRMNFACPQHVLEDALSRIKDTVERFA